MTVLSNVLITLPSNITLVHKSVEMESIIQEYEDKLIKQKYQHKDIAAINATAQEPKEGQEAQ
jgi:hypothetical protein